MQKNLTTTASPSTTTFIVDTGTPDKPTVDSVRKSTQSLVSSRTGNAKKQSGRKVLQQQGGLGKGKRSEANMHDKRHSIEFHKSWGRPENNVKDSMKSVPGRKGNASQQGIASDNREKRKVETGIKSKKQKPTAEREIMETASSFNLGKPYHSNREVNSDVSSSTFVVEPKKGEDSHGENAVERKKSATKKKSVCFKIYKRSIPKNLRHRWRYHTSSPESAEEEPKRAAKVSTQISSRVSEPWMMKEFVWKNQGKSALSINSSLGHINCDDLEDFFRWERLPATAITCTWEAFLYKWKKSWSVLSMAAFRKNRLSDTPGEILQMLKDGNRRIGRVRDATRQDLVPSSPFDVEPSIFQKNIDIRNWVEALRFYAIRGEEERGTTEEMSKSDPVEFAWRKIDREGNAFSTFLAFLLGLIIIGYIIPNPL